jgi:hypothetical protein
VAQETGRPSVQRWAGRDAGSAGVGWSRVNVTSNAVADSPDFPDAQPQQRKYDRYRQPATLGCETAGGISGCSHCRVRAAQMREQSMACLRTSRRLARFGRFVHESVHKSPWDRRVRRMIWTDSPRRDPGGLCTERCIQDQRGLRGMAPSDHGMQR